MANVVGDGARGVGRLPVLEGSDELGDDEGPRAWDDPRGDSSAIHALERRQQRHSLLVRAIRAQNRHGRRLPVGGLVQAQQLQGRGRGVPDERLQRRQRVRASVGNHDLVNELLAALGLEERREDLLAERVNEGALGGGTQGEGEQMPEERVRVLRAKGIDALLPQARVAGAGVSVDVGEHARLKDVGRRQGDTARVQHREDTVRGLIGVGRHLDEGDLQHQVLDEILDLVDRQNVRVGDHLEHGPRVVVDATHRRRGQGTRIDVEQRVDIVADNKRVKEITITFAHEQPRPLIQPLDRRFGDAQALVEVPVQAGLGARQVTQQGQEDAERRHALLAVDNVDVVAAGVTHEHHGAQEVVAVVRAPRAEQVVDQRDRLRLLPHVGALEVWNLVLAVAGEQGIE